MADLLSRIPENGSESTVETGLEAQVCQVTVDLPQRSAAETREAQLKDAEVREIIEAFEKSISSNEYMRHAARGYLMSGGVLYRYSLDFNCDEPQLLVPVQERDAVLKAYHDSPTSGHYGAERTLARIAHRYHWMGMSRQVADYVKRCGDCQRYKASNLRPAGLLQTPVMKQCFEVLAMDLFGPLVASPEGMRWIFIVEDCASRWVELFALYEATAERCATTLLDEVILRYGVPRRIISDNGGQFTSDVMQKLVHCLGVDQALNPVYHPQAIWWSGKIAI